MYCEMCYNKYRQLNEADFVNAGKSLCMRCLVQKPLFSKSEPIKWKTTMEEIVKEIETKTKKPKEEIERMIRDKQSELSGLVSPEGAGYIVARELGISLIKEAKNGTDTSK